MTRRAALVAVAAAVALGGALGALTLPGVPVPPAFQQVREEHRPSEARLLDREGRLLHELRVDPQGRRLEWATLGEVSPALVRTVMEAEDRRFREHGGVDLRAAAGAAWHALTGGPRRGASTLTMQLAALLDPSLRPGEAGRGLRQKWTQVRAAWALEGSWTKDQILEGYLNLAAFRGELQGVGAASRGLFGKAPAGLDEAEGLLLTALLPTPNASPEAVAARACRLAGRLGDAAPCPRLRTLAWEALGRPPRVRPAAALAPHLARRLLRLGAAAAATTLDADAQAFAAEALERAVLALAERNVRDGAVLVAENRSGDILAYVGNSGTNPAAAYVDGVLAYRQAGSTLKPFLYGLAFEERRLTAASFLDDAPVNLTTPTGLYVPQNYDRDFRGLVTARTALAASLNIPAVRTLRLTGVDAFVGRLRALGFRGLVEDADHYGYALALGSAEVTLWELVGAYRALAREGLSSALRLVPSEAGGDSESEARRVLDEGAAFVVSDVLADRSARSLTFGLHGPLATPFWSAVKTGTSKDLRDNWCVGYSDRFTVGVWVGNFDGEPMHGVSGVAGAAPVWQEIMAALHPEGSAGAPAPPEGLSRTPVRFVPPVEPPRAEWFLPGTETQVMALAGRSSRISYPGADTILALDPDIPRGRERVYFRMDPPNPRLTWSLDGEPVPASWEPAAGRHRLALVDGERGVLDEVVFQVRGSRAP